MSYEIQGEVPYTAVEYGDGDSEEAVALVAGFGGLISDVEQAAKDLAETGRDVVAYAYHPRVLSAGDGELLPQFIETLSTDFRERTPDYYRRRFGGVSLGGAIASGMQKSYEKYNNPERGLYAATGSEADDVVMKNHIFRAIVWASHRIDIRRAYERNGYTPVDLRERWNDIQIPPLTPTTVVLGGLDLIIQQHKVLSRAKEWRAAGRDVRVIRKPWLNHNRTIKWFNDNIISLLDPEPAVEPFGGI